LKRYEVTETQIKRIEDSIPIWHQILFSGQAHVWVAKPNGGKTAMATQAAADLARCGYEVFYFQLDSGGPDLKDLYRACLSS
jgi:KaiC/GvpD/RAD55 family RecA-like ATPase